MPPRRALVPCLALCALAACGTPAPAGLVPGALDLHCALPDGGARAQPVAEASCHATGGGDAGVPEAPEPLFNGEGDDADCKFHLRLSTTAVARDRDVTFTLVATHKGDGAALLGAEPSLEATLGAAHPAPNSGAATAEAPGGTYTIGPLRFDQPGRWTVEVHLFHHCTDVLEDSPHAHAAFLVDVP